MRGWRSKLIFLLVVYFAGFATAIYVLAPAPEDQACRHEEKSLAFSSLKPDEFVESFNAGIHKCLELIKDAAWHTGKFLKQKYKERQQKTDR